MLTNEIKFWLEAINSINRKWLEQGRMEDTFAGINSYNSVSILNLCVEELKIKL